MLAKVFSINELTSAFSDKRLLPVWLVVALIILWDLSSRFSNQAQLNENDWQLEMLDASERRQLSDQDADALLALFARFNNESSNSAGEKGLTQEQLLAQKGELKELYSSALKYRLVGIIGTDERVAVLTETQLASGTSKLREVKASQSLEEYKVEAVQADGIKIMGNGNSIFLKLYNWSK